MTEERTLYPPIEPFASEWLDVGDGHRLWIEQCGRPDGIPVLFLHGGPGSGCSPEHRRLFDPERYRAILLDQRGCGRSLPLGRLAANTTPHLVGDLECVRLHLGIDRWWVFGGSWGSLLGLAYAQAHPESVVGLVLRGIFLGSDEEIGSYLSGSELDLGACRDAVLGKDENKARSAARAWLNHERQLMGELPLSELPNPARMAKVAIQMHYLPAACFVDAGQLLAGVDRIRSLPGVIVQGLDDPVCPPAIARQLAERWPEAQLVLLPGVGHSGLDPIMAAACMQALRAVTSR